MDFLGFQSDLHNLSFPTKSVRNRIILNWAFPSLLPLSLNIFVVRPEKSVSLFGLPDVRRGMDIVNLPEYGLFVKKPGNYDVMCGELGNPNV